MAVNDIFQDFLLDVEPLSLREPLAEALGAFRGKAPILSYTFVEALKMAGHPCPSVAGAYLVTGVALGALYPGVEVPVRGEIAVVVYGEPSEAAYGVMAQVIGFITGAAPATGFKGLAGRFGRKNLLAFSDEKPDPAAVAFEFKRLDSGKAVLVKFFPWAVPFPEDKAERMGALMGGAVSGRAAPEETEEFRALWMEKIRLMLIERKDIQNWIQVEER